DGRAGVCYTRTGRPFFDDAALEAALLARVLAALEASDRGDECAPDWVVLDCELLPWSAKAQALLRDQYAAVGAAARVALPASIDALETAAARGLEVGGLLEDWRTRAVLTEQYVAAYGRYCWPVTSLDDLKLAPFHLLASASGVHTDRDHRWHMQTLARVCAADEQVLLATNWREVDLGDPAAEAEATAWWTTLTEAGGEGMVVKP